MDRFEDEGTRGILLPLSSMNVVRVAVIVARRAVFLFSGATHSPVAWTFTIKIRLAEVRPRRRTIARMADSQDRIGKEVSLNVLLLLN